MPLKEKSYRSREGKVRYANDMLDVSEPRSMTRELKYSKDTTSQHEIKIHSSLHLASDAVNSEKRPRM